MKKAVSLVLAVVLVISLSVAVFATTGTKTAELAYRGIKITLNDEEITPRDATGSVVDPFIIDGTTYLPVRAVATALGLGVEWDGANFTVKLYKYDPSVIDFTIIPYDEDAAMAALIAEINERKSGVERVPLVEDRTAELAYRDIKITLNGKEIVPKDASGNVVEPFIIDGTTYLPVRAVSDALGLNVEWDGANFTVKLSEPAEVVSLVPTADPEQTSEAGRSMTTVPVSGTDRSVSLDPDSLVWISATGTKFHSHNDCGRMNPNKAFQMTVADAVAAGYTACEKCY